MFAVTKNELGSEINLFLCNEVSENQWCAEASMYLLTLAHDC